MSAEQQQLEAGIQALEAQRALLGDAVVDASLGALRARLAALASSAQSPIEPTQTLKQVSILFLDVVGSTLLSQHLDPEAISAVMDDALARGTAMVEAHRGKVLQYAGDNILAAFGAEASAEDDAERAVNCGLALLKLGRALGAEVQAAHRHAGFNVRVGIHTGGVLLGGGVDADGSIRGIAVNIAARMEQAAPPGALRISHDTYAQVRGLFEVEAQEPLAVKGVDAPMQSYLVLRAKPRKFRIGTRGIEGVTTRMIGRDSELEALQAAFKRLFEERRLAAVTVVADAGIGKSRLLYEFEAWSEARPETFCLFRGRATPQTGHQAYGLLRDILAWRFQIVDDDTIEAARQKMEAGIVPLFIGDDGAELAEAHAHLLGHLIGIEWRDSRHLRGILEDAKQIRNRAFHAAAQLFRRVSASNDAPVILQLEDLHWADSESLDFLNYLAEVNRDVPLLVLAFTRPTLFERRTDWSSTQGIHHRIDLAPLGKDMSRLLAGELLKKLPEIPAALRELLTSSAEGNPFYMEELVKMLIDQGVIQTRPETGESWQVDAQRLLLTQVPPTLTGVLQARLDGLPRAEKLTLQEASVIGPVFWDRALFALDAQAEQTLPALVRRELALPRVDAENATTNGDDLREYAFKHQILHQVTYATVLKRTRRELHGKLAHWLAGMAGLRANDFLGMAAEHFEQAGDEAQAAEFHAQAAEHASKRMAGEAVLAHVERALALLDAQPGAGTERKTLELRWRLLAAREETLDLQGARAAQRASIETLESLAEALADDRQRAFAAQRRGTLELRMADWTAAEAAAQRGLAWATAAGDVALRRAAQRTMAMALINRGDLAGAEALLEPALAEARALELHGAQGYCLSYLADIADRRGDDVAPLELLRQALAAFEAQGDRRNEATARSNLGVGWLRVGEFHQARKELEEGLRVSRALGYLAAQCVPLYNLSTLALWQGDDTRALGFARNTVETAVAVQGRDFEAIALLALGDAELALGRHAAAALAFRRAQDLAIEINHPWQHNAAAGLARVALARGDSAAALQAIAPLLTLDADRGGNASVLEGTERPREIELTCYRVLGAQRGGDPRAFDWLRRAHEALQAGGARLTDARVRQGYFQNIPHHREIVAAWAKRGAGGEAGAVAVG